MKLVQTGFAGLVVIAPRVFADARGYFLETWSQRAFAEAGLPTEFAQDNFSRSTRGILRGLHFQNPNPQGKLVRCTLGRVWDVAVDIRPASPSFGRHFGLELSEENRLAMYVPPGSAHGFCVLSDEAHFQYKCTTAYSPEGDCGVQWNDPALAIPWPLDGEPLLSDKDRTLEPLAEVLAAGRLAGL